MLRIAAFLVVFAGLTSATWHLYKQKFNKTYGHDEDQFRRRLFERNLIEITEHNDHFDLGLVPYRQALNQFSDMTREELKSFTGTSMNETDKASAGSAEAQRGGLKSRRLTGDPAKELDWRSKGYVTRVKNQGQCGSCYAFAATGAMEGQLFKATGKLISLSEQQIVDCSHTFLNAGCRGGFMPRAWDYVHSAGGLVAEESYLYKNAQGICAVPKDKFVAKIRTYKQVPSGDEEGLKRTVAEIGPIAIVFHVIDSFFKYTSGVYDDPSCSSQSPNHAMLVVGYGTEDGVDYWLIKNSWGPSWGRLGYAKVVRNKGNMCGVALAAYYPILEIPKQ